MPNKELTARVRFETTDAERKLKRLSKLIAGIDKSLNRRTNKSGLETQISKARIQQEKLNQAILKTKLAEEKVTTQKQKTAQAASKVKNEMAQTIPVADSLLSTVKRIAGAYLGMQGLKLGIEVSDKITGTENRLNNLEGATPAMTAEAMDKIYAAAQRARTSYTGMMSDVSKTMTLAGDSFQGNIDNAIRFQEIMAKSYVVGGASATEASTSMYQLVQALGSGVLQGDELRSVREGAPLAYKEIEKFAQGVFNTEESLKDLASQGVITSDIVVAAIMASEDKINESFENTSVTFAQTWERIKNTATRALQPVLQKLNDFLNSEKGQRAVENITQAIIKFAVVFGAVVEIFANFFGWCADNWYWLQHVVVGVLIMMITYLVMKSAYAIAGIIQEIIEWVTLNTVMAQTLGTIFVITVAILLLFYVWMLFANGTIKLNEAIAWSILIIGVAIGIVMLIFENIWGLLVIGIAAILALIINFFAETCGAFMWLGATFLNIVIGLINAILQVVWLFVRPFIGIIEFVLNATQGGFDGFLGGLKNAFGQVLSWLVDVAKIATKLWDAIFGTNATDKLGDLQNKLESWGKNEKAITLNKEAPEIERLSAKAAYQTGYEWGLGVEDKVNEWGSKFQNGSNLLEGVGNIFDPSLQLGDAYDPSGIADDIAKGLEELNGTTNDISDKIDYTDDDLEYLRKIAEMEWRKEFTTAEIRVEMTNNNNVNGERDLDGIVSYLADTLREEMTNVAYGVHY